MIKTRSRPSGPGYYWYKDSLDESWSIVRVRNFLEKGELYADGEEVQFKFLAGEINEDDELEFWSEDPIPEPE
jgi:hypothetical protein